jgi:hypothetical protein
LGCRERSWNDVCCCVSAVAGGAFVKLDEHGGGAVHESRPRGGRSRPASQHESGFAVQAVVECGAMRG